jgi:hypothetical protein
MLRTRRARALVAIAVAAGVLLFYPFKVTVTDLWTLTALNSDGHPIAGCRIEQQWEWGAIGVNDSAALTTDRSGKVLFPRRTVRASVAARAWGSLATFNFHGPASGRRVQFFACNEKNVRTQLGIYQLGDTMMYEHRVPTVWRDSSMLK